jgi:hypothetical protein
VVLVVVVVLVVPLRITLVVQVTHLPLHQHKATLVVTILPVALVPVVVVLAVQLLGKQRALVILRPLQVHLLSTLKAVQENQVETKLPTLVTVVEGVDPLLMGVQ